jgi:threonine dehydrogenase-like Zn-dependent dehydrogenase
MKALVVSGQWSPKEGYRLSADEASGKWARAGSQVWKNTVFEIKDVPTPDPQDDEVLVRVKRCGICGSDAHLHETDKEGYILFSGQTKLPCIIGHEFSGVVEKAGRRVTNFKKGDMVAAESIMWCGMCHACRSGAPNQCKNVRLLGLSVDGALAQYISIKEKYCWNISGLLDAYKEDDVFDAGALIEPVGCAYNGIFISGGGFLPGATAAVYGAGPIGLGAVALLKICGASRIIVFDLMDERLKIAEAMGADYAFNTLKMNNNGTGDKVMELTDGMGADIQVEAAGAALTTIPEMEKALSGRGKIIYLGRSARTAPINLDGFVSGANAIFGARGHSGYGIYPNIIRLMASGRLNPCKMITSRYPFESAISGFNASAKKTDGKILIEMP